MARICVAEGARAIHLHPRDMYGAERLDAPVVDHVVTVVKDACGVPVGVGTGPWIEPDLDRCVEQILSWRAPDYALVDFGDPGAAMIMEACLEAGVAVEAGLSTVEAVEALAASGLGPRALRVMVAPFDVPSADALTVAEDIHAALDRSGLSVPRLQHGNGEAAWILLADALHRGIDTRIGLEDTLFDPGGDRAVGNAALVRAAVRFGAR